MLQDYIRFARAKGLSRSRIVGVHVTEEHHDPGRHGSRPRARLDDRFRRRDRDGVRLSGHGQAPDRFHQSPRPSDHRRLPDADGADLCRSSTLSWTCSTQRSIRACACPKRKADRWPTSPRTPSRRSAPHRSAVRARIAARASCASYRRVLPQAGRRARSCGACRVRARLHSQHPRSRRRTPTTLPSSTSWTTCWRRARPWVGSASHGSARTTRAATCFPPSSTACASRLPSAPSRFSSHASSALLSACSRPMRAAASKASSCASSTCSFPSRAILVALVLLAAFGRGVDKVVLALVIVQWAYYARTVRGSALIEKRREYIEAARCLALPRSRIVFRHLLPNCLPPLIVVATVQIAHAIALESTLSFLGVGVPVTEPSLGMLIATGYDYLLSGKYWVSTFPGVALVIVIVGDQPRRRPAARRAEPEARAMSEPVLASATSRSRSRRARARSMPSTACPSRCAAARFWGSSANPAPASRSPGSPILGPRRRAWAHRARIDQARRRGTRRQA